jgi:hypothetical protein
MAARAFGARAFGTYAGSGTLPGYVAPLPGYSTVTYTFAPARLGSFAARSLFFLR